MSGEAPICIDLGQEENVFFDDGKPVATENENMDQNEDNSCDVSNPPSPPEGAGASGHGMTFKDCLEFSRLTNGKIQELDDNLAELLESQVALLAEISVSTETETVDFVFKAKSSSTQEDDAQE